MEKVLKKVPVIGFVRYSQKIDFGDPMKDVFEPTYFEYRFKIFRDVTLKCFQQQTDKNFILLILHSENMPAHYKKWFYELQETNTFLQNIFVKDSAESFNDALQKSIDYVSFQNEVAITFRIDNDDAVQYDFIEKMKRFVKKDFVGYVISMPMIYITKRISDKLYMVEERYYPSNSIGLAYVTCRENYKTVLEIAQHHLTNEQYPLILLAKSAGIGLQTINGENAANTIDGQRSKIFNKEEFLKYLAIHKLENLDLDCMRIFEDNSSSTKNKFVKGIKLFVPPVVLLFKYKLKKNYSTLQAKIQGYKS